jgi:hypothetical protein
VQETVFLQAGGIGLVLWHEDKLAEDAGFDYVPSGGFRGVTLAHNVRSRDDVDAVMAAARAAGASISRAPAETFYGGYAGHFTDPDGHAWEIAYNPGFPLGDDGSLTIPEHESGVAGTRAVARSACGLTRSRSDRGDVPDIRVWRAGRPAAAAAVGR